ncbi:hypothetical protein EDB80DRAFT_568452, partial [Ilyonectria destructans]
LVVATQAFQDHIVRYFEHHQTPGMNKKARSFRERVLEYDACAQLWVRSCDDWLTVSNSEEYKTALGDDGKKFMAFHITYMIGYEIGDTSKTIGTKGGFYTRTLKEAPRIL